MENNGQNPTARYVSDKTWLPGRREHNVNVA